MIEAWLRASVMMQQSSDRSGSKTPPFGVETGGVEDGVVQPQKIGQRALQILVDLLRPQMNRTDDKPNPH